MAHTYTNLIVHLVFSTKDRTPCLDDAICAELYPYLGGVLNQLDARAIAIGGWYDHVHILGSFSAKRAFSDVVRDTKSGSSGWLKRRFPNLKQFAWQTGYGSFSVSHSNIDSVRKYIANQHEHHKRVSFQEEFIAFLEKQAMPYDLKFIWK